MDMVIEHFTGKNPVIIPEPTNNSHIFILLPLASLAYLPNSESRSTSPVNTGPSLHTLSPAGSIQQLTQTPIPHFRYRCRLNCAQALIPDSLMMPSARHIIFSGPQQYI